MTAHDKNQTLFEQGGHRNVMLRTFDVGPEVPCNQHVIIDGTEAMILDPGGHKLYSKVFAATKAALGNAKLTHLFLSHQDPDIVAATNGWLMALPEMQAYCSKLWRRFVAHIGPDRLLYDRMIGIEDGGCRIALGNSEVWAIPAHFLHSCGNFHVYDPVSKILYTGDLGASLGEDYRVVTDFDAHIQYMEGFHRRYMSSTKALKHWLVLARKLDIETIAPQHGAMFEGREMSQRFLDWIDSLEVGVDQMEPYDIPT
ncbi:MAG: MBL fold metallo-hydrolase [Proteobacteria bacterium]|nr:MBL fold metallo-hydrolase [Pseudomonadota bacterium]